MGRDAQFSLDERQHEARRVVDAAQDFTPGKKYPLVVNVHGGPSSACAPHWDAKTMGPESAMGYFAFCPNPRGSYGQGETFTQGNVKDFGGGDFRDIMAGLTPSRNNIPSICNASAFAGTATGAT